MDSVEQLDRMRAHQNWHPLTARNKMCECDAYQEEKQVLTKNNVYFIIVLLFFFTKISQKQSETKTR